MSVENYAQARDRIDPKYREEFYKFIKTGEANQEFLDYVNNNAQAREAVEWMKSSKIFACGNDHYWIDLNDLPPVVSSPDKMILNVASLMSPNET